MATSWRGDWDSGTAYAVGDGVNYGSKGYFCVTANTGQEPGTGDDWVLGDLWATPSPVNLGGDSAAAGLKTATTTVDVSAAAAPSAGQVLTATGDSAADWETPSSGSGTVTSVTAADTSVVVGGTSADPTVRTATLDVIATGHPPAANWSNNGKKITSLGNGGATQDAAAFGQTPAGGNTVTVPQGGTGETSLTPYAPLTGGTSSTAGVQSAATGLSTSGNVLTSNGSSALPSFQALPGFAPLPVAPSGDTTGAADHTAIAAAITALGSGGGVVGLGPGAFWLNAGLTLPAGVFVAGAGPALTTVKVADGASAFTPFLIQNVSNAGVRDLTLDLNKANTSSGNNGIYANAGTTSVTGIDIRRVTVINGWQAGVAVIASPATWTIGFTLEDVTVTGCAGSGIDISGGQGATITRASVSGCGGSGGGIFVGGSSDVKIIASESTGNTSHGLAFTFRSYNLASSGFQVTGGNYSGNNASGSTGYGIVASEGSYDFTITGARCEGNGAGGIGVDTAWDASRVTGTAASGSVTTLTDSTAAWPVNTWAGWTVRFTSGTGSGQSAVITSNTATTLTFGTVTTAPDATTHYAIDGSHIFTDAAATITGCVCAYNTNQGIWADYCSNLTVTGCEVHHNGSAGVDLVAQYCLITGNDIHDNTSHGVVINQGSDPMGGHRVTGNAYRNNTSPDVQQAATTYPNVVVDEALLAPLASAALTGTPTAPTATALTSNTQIATTAYADTAVGAEATRATTAEALKAPLASPALTGTPTAPTKTALTNSTAIATTAYADAAVAAAVPYGKRAAYSAITAAVTATAAANTLTSQTAFTGAPSITLPSDGHTYRVTFSAPYMTVSAQQFFAIGIGTSASAILKYCYSGVGGELSAPCIIVTDVTGAGQAISCYAYSGSGSGNVTMNAAANAPAELSAVLVA